MISEAVFEARFSHASQLCRMGADIQIESRRAVVCGVERLYGAEVFGRDLRGTAALLTAALAAEGESCVHGSEFLERGYEKIEEVFSFLGGEIRLTEERKTIVDTETTDKQTRKEAEEGTETIEAAGRQ